MYFTIIIILICKNRVIFRDCQRLLILFFEVLRNCLHKKRNHCIGSVSLSNNYLLALSIRATDDIDAGLHGGGIHPLAVEGEEC